MARYLALEWQLDELVAVVAESTRGGSLVVEQAFALPLIEAPLDQHDASSGEDDAHESPTLDVAALEAKLIDRLRDDVRSHKLGKVETIVALQRNDVELRPMTLPPAPDEELPDMVRFQAAREFNELNDQWPLDFEPLSDDVGQQRSVLAAAVRPELLQRIRATCEGAGVACDRLQLKPCGTAALWRRSPLFEPNRVDLLVGLSHGEANLIAVLNGRVVFLRAARMAVDPLADPENANALTAEIRRTMMAVHSQLQGRRVERIVLRGADARHQFLAESLGRKLSLPALAFDALDGIERRRDAEMCDDDTLETVTSLIGLLVEHADPETRPLFDFLHPRRAPKPVGPRNKIVAGAAAAAALAVLLLGGLLYWDHLVTLEVRALQARKHELTKELPDMEATAERARAIDAWDRSRVNWLDELKWLSEQLPPSEDVLLKEVKCFEGAVPGAPGRITLEGFAREREVLGTLEESLRDDAHRVVGGDKSVDRKQPRYEIGFDETIYVTPPAQRKKPTPKDANDETKKPS